MKKAALFFTVACAIVISFNVVGYSQPASRSVRRRGVPRIGRDRRMTKIVTPAEIAVIKDEALIREQRPSYITATVLDDGDVFIGWSIRNQADQIVGEGRFFTKSLQPAPSVYYTRDSTSGQQAAAFSDGRVLIASKDGYVIVDKQGKIVRGHTPFDDEDITDISVTPLSGGQTVLIAYHRQVPPRGDGRYVIVNRSGEILHGPVLFNDKGKTSYISAATLPNGLVLLAYNCSGSKTKVIDVFNHTIVDEQKFHAKRIYDIESVVLDDDHILLAYIDQDFKGQCQVVRPNGVRVSGPHQFSDEDLNRIRLAKRKDGNVCVAFATRRDQGRCAIVDAKGQCIKGPVPIYDGYEFSKYSFDCVHLRDNMVMIVFNAKKKGSSDRSDYVGAYIVVR